MALSTRRKKILAWYLLEASNEFLRTLLEKLVDEEPLLDERSGIEPALFIDRFVVPSSCSLRCVS